MIRAFDLRDLSLKEVSIPFQALSLTRSVIPRRFQVTTLGTELTKARILEAVHSSDSVRLSAHRIANPTCSHFSSLPRYKPQHHEAADTERAYSSWERKSGWLFFSSLFPSQLGLFQTSSLPNEDMVKDHLSIGNLPVSFPQFPLKGKPAVVGKSPEHLGTRR